MKEKNILSRLSQYFVAICVTVWMCIVLVKRYCCQWGTNVGDAVEQTMAQICSAAAIVNIRKTKCQYNTHRVHLQFYSTTLLSVYKHSFQFSAHIWWQSWSGWNNFGWFSSPCVTVTFCSAGTAWFWPDYQSALTYQSREGRQKQRNSAEIHEHQCWDHNVFYDPV